MTSSAHRKQNPATPLAPSALAPKAGRREPPANADAARTDLRNKMDALLAISGKFAQLPIVDSRKADEILGYGANGLP
jgi:hypothetical protein